MNQVDGFNNRLDTVGEMIMNWKISQNIQTEAERKKTYGKYSKRPKRHMQYNGNGQHICKMEFQKEKKDQSRSNICKIIKKDFSKFTKDNTPQVKKKLPTQMRNIKGPTPKYMIVSLLKTREYQPDI